MQSWYCCSRLCSVWISWRSELQPCRWEPSHPHPQQSHRATSVDPKNEALSFAISARRRDTWPEVVLPHGPNKDAPPSWEKGGPRCNWPDSGGLNVGQPPRNNSLQRTRPNTAGQHQPGQTQPSDSTVVYSVNPTASYSIQGHIQGTPATFLVDTGSVISIVKSAVWTQSDPKCQQLTPYTGRQLVGVEGTPLSVRGNTTADVSFGSESFQVPVIVVDQLLADAILGLDFLEDHQCTIDIASRMLSVGGNQHRLPLVTGNQLHHPWTGPNRVVKRLTDSIYRIQLLSNPRKRLVVHFDRLKLCSTGAQAAPAETSSAPESTNTPPAGSSSGQGIPSSIPIGTSLEVVELADNPQAGQRHQPQPQLPIPTHPGPRYSSRNRLLPDRYGDLVPI